MVKVEPFATVTLENSFFQMSSSARAYVRITYVKTEVFRWEHHVVWNGKAAKQVNLSGGASWD